MYDLKFVRAHHQELREAIRKKGESADLDVVIGLDERRRALLVEVETLKAEPLKHDHRLHQHMVAPPRFDGREQAKRFSDSVQGTMAVSVKITALSMADCKRDYTRLDLLTRAARERLSAKLNLLSNLIEIAPREGSVILEVKLGVPTADDPMRVLRRLIADRGLIAAEIRSAIQTSYVFTTLNT